MTALWLCIVFLAYVLGLVTQEWATRGVNRAVARALPEKPADGDYFIGLAPYWLGVAEEVLRDSPPDTFRTLRESFPKLSPYQIADLLVRRHQERHSA